MFHQRAVLLRIIFSLRLLNRRAIALGQTSELPAARSPSTRTVSPSSAIPISLPPISLRTRCALSLTLSDLSKIETACLDLWRRSSGTRARPRTHQRLGINIGIGLGVFGFALLSLLIATHDFKLVERIDALRPLSIAFPAAFFALSLRFWFYLPALISATATACFIVATAVSP